MADFDRFVLAFKTTNAAFEDDPVYETARLLRAAADRIEGGELSGKLHDVNGNSIGSFDFD